jgi:hypothetical protein
VEAWRDFLAWARMHPNKPLWSLVPDVVADRLATLRNWDRFAPEVEAARFTPAFAVQDGMSPADVPQGAAVVFVGGTTEWKWRTLKTWTSHFPRVHVGRVGEVYRLWQCEDAGAESCDSTSWFRESDDGQKMRAISDWLEGHRPAETPALAMEFAPG